MSQYYYLVTGLPVLSLDDNKLNFSVADFKKDFYPHLTKADQQLFDLFYLKYDNANLLKLLKDKEALLDERGNYAASAFISVIDQINEDSEAPIKTELPSYLVDFIVYYLSPDEDKPDMLAEDVLSSKYYEYALQCKNPFVSALFEFNLNVNNLLVALAARKFKMQVPPLIVGHTEVCDALRESNARDFGLIGKFDYLDEVIKISEVDDLAEREKKVDLLRWKWIEDTTFFEYFSAERLYAFLNQLEMVERWISLDKEKGNEMFRAIITSLKNEVKVPDEII